MRLSLDAVCCTGPRLLVARTGPRLLVARTGPRLLVARTGPRLLVARTGPCSARCTHRALFCSLHAQGPVCSLHAARGGSTAASSIGRGNRRATGLTAAPSRRDNRTKGWVKNVGSCVAVARVPAGAGSRRRGKASYEDVDGWLSRTGFSMLSHSKAVSLSHSKAGRSGYENKSKESCERWTRGGSHGSS